MAKNPQEDPIRRVSTGRVDLQQIINRSFKDGKIYMGHNGYVGHVAYATDTKTHSLFGVFKDHSDAKIYFKATPARTDAHADDYIHELLVRPMERNHAKKITEEKFYESVANDPKIAKRTIEELLEGKE